MKLKLQSLLALTAGVLFTQNINAQSLVGITQDDKVFTMANIAAPGLISTPITVTGMTAGQTIAGADVRPLTGELYIMGYDALSNTAQIYSLNTATGVAAAISSTPMSLGLGATDAISFDFDPTMDRIRVVGANGKNYNINPVNGAIVSTDADLSFGLADVNHLATPSIGAIAYTNSYVGAGTTALYSYDMALNVLAAIDSPATGVLHTIGNTGLMVNTVTHSIDMDVYVDPVTLNSTAYLAANTNADLNDNLYSIDLNTGIATSLGLIGGGLDVKNIAITINRALPAVTGKMIFGVQNKTNTLVSFDSDNPRLLRTYMPVTGMASGQMIAGLDFRPSDGKLYAMGYDYLSGQYQLYTINTATGTATAVNSTAAAINLGMSNNVAFDFDPVADKVRVISRETGMNYRINPTSGAIEMTDTAIVYGTSDVNAGKTPHIGAIAYTNSYNHATVTELYALDDSLGSMVKLGSPNGGMLTTTAASLVMVNATDMSSDIDFFYDSTSMNNVGYIAVNSMTSLNDKLYTVNTNSSSMSLVSDIGLGVSMSDIAVQPQYKNAVVGIASIENKPQFTVYPNPATNDLYINVTGANADKAYVSIADITGRVVKNTIVLQGRVSISDLQNGIYFVRLNVNGTVYATQKIVKQ
ncbi:MAG: hypothetical protein BGO70_12660 [Bacteroidetes bacterium 43-93]|nr:DUF4394 domain-containing protein [Bacteroidota bacterium]OJW99297.1 MAG: hypothetical protein BGO70_12660 [Bacteroidetes bacterium 43-93]